MRLWQLVLFVGNKGKKREVACALDRNGQFALLTSGHAGDTRRQDLTPWREVTLEQRDVPIVNLDIWI